MWPRRRGWRLRSQAERAGAYRSAAGRAAGVAGSVAQPRSVRDDRPGTERTGKYYRVLGQTS